MSTQARIRIESHRLMRTAPLSQAETHAERVDGAAFVGREREREERARLVRRVLVHIGIFVASFVFAAGVLLLAVLLWVRPEALLALVVAGMVAAVSFVALFAGLRVAVLHFLMHEYPNKEDDPGMRHHVAKSVAYGFVALALAMLFAGFLVNVATAFK